MADSTSVPVSLVVATRAEGDSLTVEYTIRNDFTEAIYFYAVPSDLETDSLRPGKAYVDYDDETFTLELSLIPPPPPPGVNFFSGPMSLSRRLAAGQAYRGELHFEIPVQLWDPYPALPDPETEVAWWAGETEVEEPDDAAPPVDLPPARALRFTTGFFQESKLVGREPGPDPDTFWCDGAFFRERSAEVPLPAPVPVAF